MPEFINNVATQDNYVPALTLGPAADVALINFSVLSNPVLVQFWVAQPGQTGKFILEEFERLYVDGSFGVQALGVYGVRFRSSIVGTPARIVAELAFKNDPKVSGGSLSSATVNSSGQLVSAGVPSGTILAFAGAAAPTGFVLADGAHYDGTTGAYQNLWAAIGLTYGGTGQADFAVPDLRGRAPFGKGTNADVAALGQSDGFVVLSRSPRHNSTTSVGVSLTDPGHTHQVFGYAVLGAAGAAQATWQTPGGNPATTDNGTPVHTGISVGVTVTVGPGGSRPVDTPAYLTVNYIVAL
jgi:microcystin-dependent protein